jgi:hypothetical protein
MASSTVNPLTAPEAFALPSPVEAPSPRPQAKHQHPKKRSNSQPLTIPGGKQSGVAIFPVDGLPDWGWRMAERSSNPQTPIRRSPARGGGRSVFACDPLRPWVKLGQQRKPTHLLEVRP